MERRFAAGTLWPDLGDACASGNLRSALWQLRHVGVDMLMSDKSSLSLSDAVCVLISEVARWAAGVLPGQQDPKGAGARHEYLNALNLLPGWFDEWVIVERERLWQRMLHAIEEASRLMTRVGSYGDSIQFALAEVTAEPLSERAQRVLIEGYLGVGNVIEAHRACMRYSQPLYDKLTTIPSPALSALVPPRLQDLQVGAPALRSITTAAAGNPRRQPGR